MKKIIMLVLMLMAFAGVCAAFEQPDPARWTEVARDTTNTNTFWLDTKTLRFEKKHGDSYANFWVMSRRTEEETYVMINLEMNMDRKEYRALSENRYDAKGKVTASKSEKSAVRAIPQGSILEVLYGRIAEIRKG